MSWNGDVCSEIDPRSLAGIGMSAHDRIIKTQVQPTGDETAVEGGEDPVSLSSYEGD